MNRYEGTIASSALHAQPAAGNACQRDDDGGSRHERIVSTALDEANAVLSGLPSPPPMPLWH